MAGIEKSPPFDFEGVFPELCNQTQKPSPTKTMLLRAFPSWFRIPSDAHLLYIAEFKN